MIVLAADLGGTTIVAGVLVDGAVLARRTIPAHADNGLATRLDDLRTAWRAALDDTSHAEQSVDAVGIAFPGLVNAEIGRVISTPDNKYADAPSIDLNRWAHAAFAAELAIEGDANAALLGERHRGAAAGSDNVVMLTLGTGIGSSVIIEGRPLRGAHGAAGTLGGHFSSMPAGRRCICGNRGCVETIASSWALPQIVAELNGDDSNNNAAIVQQLARGYEYVFKRAAEGDPLAKKILNASLAAWGAAAVNMIHAYDPDRLVVGGSIAKSADVVIPAIQRYVDAHAWTAAERVRVVAATTGPDAPLIGMWVAARSSLGLESA